MKMTACSTVTSVGAAENDRARQGFGEVPGNTGLANGALHLALAPSQPPQAPADRQGDLLADAPAGGPGQQQVLQLLLKN